MAKLRKRGRPKNVETHFRELLQNIIPVDDMFEKDEKDVFNKLVETYLKDFDETQLSANDIDDILSVATNKVLEFRLLKTGKGDADRIIDTSTAIDRLRKQTEKLKESLATRRRDRIDPKKYSGFSIIDLAVAWDKGKKDDAENRIKMFTKEEEIIKKSPLLVGNREDQDAAVLKKEEN